MGKQLLITYKTTATEPNGYNYGIFHLNYSDSLSAVEKVDIILSAIADAYNKLTERKFNLIKGNQVVIINSLEL